MLIAGVGQVPPRQSPKLDQSSRMCGLRRNQTNMVLPRYVFLDEYTREEPGLRAATKTIEENGKRKQCEPAFVFPSYPVRTFS